MKCEYCPLKQNCNKKFYECDRQLVIRGKNLVCESAESCKIVDDRMKHREYDSVEKVLFLGFVFNRVKLGRYNR